MQTVSKNYKILPQSSRRCSRFFLAIGCVFISFFLTSCTMEVNGKPVEFAGLRLLNSSTSTRQDQSDGQTGSFRYGNFCGAGNDQGSTENDSLIRLLRNEPVDDIDKACKWHDVCYTQKGYLDLNCDRELMNRLVRMQFQDERCSSLSQAMFSYLAAAHPTYNSSSTGETLLHYTLRTISLPFALMGATSAMKSIEKYKNLPPSTCTNIASSIEACSINQTTGQVTCD